MTCCSRYPRSSIRFMRFACCLATILFIAGCAESKAPPASPPISDSRSNPGDSSSSPNDQDSLDGTWEVVQCDRDGASYPQEIGGTVTFDGRRADVTSTDGTVVRYEIHLNPDASPRTIDWTMTVENQSVTLKGLYALQNSVLHTCSAGNFGDDRPTDLVTTPGDGRWLFQLKRAASP